MLKLFDKDCDVSIVLSEHCEKAVLLAARDLQENLRYLSGRKDGFPIMTDLCEKPSIRILTVREAEHSRLKDSRETESYTVTVSEAGVTVMGYDTLGTVYGIYAFSERILGFSPMYHWTGLLPAVRETMCAEEAHFSSPERKVRFRGWFINDEDLLTDWKSGGGTRDIDYPFYQNVIHPEVLDKVLETALRLEINLVIPASFVDIDNPDEEALVRAVTERGLYISQHHVEPMGVSYFAADHYIKKYGEAGEIVSFFSNRERMEEIWRYYAAKWAKYGDRVVWQLGLRGKADEAVWKADPTMPMSDARRGAILSDAIATEYEIVRETVGSDCFYSTATLWNEGSSLYGDGYLHLPESTIPIFSDFGLDQMFGEDFYTIRREAGKRYGIYYHAAFWKLGPHLAEGCNPYKMAFCYSEAARMDSLSYSILNVSNVRPIHRAVMLNAKLLRDPENFSVEKALLEADSAVFGVMGERVTALRKQYYEAFADFGIEALQEKMRAWHFSYHEYGALPFIRNAATDGQLLAFGEYALKGRAFPKDKLPALHASLERFQALYRDAEALERELPSDSRQYFGCFVRFQIGYMIRMTEWCIACAVLTDESMDAETRKQSGERGVSALEALLREREIEAEGGFADWHRGDKKVGIPKMLALMQSYMREKL